MPIYEFKCRDCGTITERFVVSFRQAGYYCTCRNCGGIRAERIMSKPAVLAGHGLAKEDGAAPNQGCAGGNPGSDGAGAWPGNDDYVRIKGQQ